MIKGSTVVEEHGGLTVGLDIGDKYTRMCVIDDRAEVVEEGSFRTTPEAVRARFEGMARALVVLEVGTHSPWLSRLLQRLGHECLIANPAALYRKGRKKSDKIDASQLARWGRADPELLKPVTHRSEEMQRELALIYSRRALVESRSKLINAVRGLAKSYGHRLPGCDAKSFHKRARSSAPLPLSATLEPLLVMIESLSREIHVLDKRIEELCEVKYQRETSAMRQIKGVGPLTALTYVLVIRDWRRFAKSRSVGAYLGLAPALDESGDSVRERGISKAGHKYLRQLLVGGAHYVLGPFGPDSTLRRWGQRKGRGGKIAKKRAAVAVARKLAVLMHHLWATGEIYEPLRGSQGEASADSNSGEADHDATASSKGGKQGRVRRRVNKDKEVRSAQGACR